MSLLYTEEQKALLALVREMAENEIKPHVKDADEKGECPRELFKWGFDMGLHMLEIPEEYGGTGLSYETTAMIFEELAKVDAGYAITFVTTFVALRNVILAGTKEQGQYFADKIAPGRFAGFALTEPNAGSDTMSMTTSVETRDGRLVLNGKKTYVNNGEYSPSILCAAIDKDTPSEDEYPSLSFWLIPHDLPGIRAVPINKIGQSMVPFASVSFDEVELKPEYRLRGHEGGFRHLFKMLEFGRVFTCAASLGMAQAAMEDAVANARVRKAFGVSIGQFQQVEQMLTDMEVSLRTMRSMLYQAAWAIETDQPDKRLAVALMKRYIPKTATEVASSAMQILGGLGYTDSARVSTIWQDCRGNQIAEGTDQIMVYISAPLIMKEYE